VPLLDGKLAGNERRAPVIAIVEDEDVGFGEVLEERALPLHGGVPRELVDESWQAEAENGVIGAACATQTVLADQVSHARPRRP
jgi:hypothetical protein